MQNDTRAEIARLDERIKALDRLANERQDAQHRINLVSNEWRGSLKDAQENSATKADVNALDARVVNLEKGVAGWLGRAGGRDSSQDTLFRILPILLSAVMLVVMLAALFWRK